MVSSPETVTVPVSLSVTGVAASPSVSMVKAARLLAGRAAFCPPSFKVSEEPSGTERVVASVKRPPGRTQLLPPVSATVSAVQSPAQESSPAPVTVTVEKSAPSGMTAEVWPSLKTMVAEVLRPGAGGVTQSPSRHSAGATEKATLRAEPSTVCATSVAPATARVVMVPPEVRVK